MDVSRAAAELIRLTLAGPPRAGAVRVAAIDGPSGSGKTTLAAEVVSRSGWPVVHLDDVYPGWDGLAETPALVADWLLRPPAEGREAGYRRYDWRLRRFGRWRPVALDGVLLLDGVGSAAAPCRPFLTAIAWVEAPAAQRHRRAIARDGELYRPYWQRWAEQEARFHAADGTQGHAGLVVDTGDSPAGVIHHPDQPVPGHSDGQ